MWYECVCGVNVSVSVWRECGCVTVVWCVCLVCVWRECGCVTVVRCVCPAAVWRALCVRVWRVGAHTRLRSEGKMGA